MLRSRPLLIIIGFVVLMGLLIFGYIATQDVYTVYADNEPITVRGNFDTVADVLQAANMTVSADDRLFPLPEMPASPENAIQLLRAKTVIVRTEDGSETYATHQPTLDAFLHEAHLSLSRTDRVVADGQQLTLAQLDDVPVPAVLEIGRINTVTIFDNGQQTTLRTGAETVGAALQEVGITLYAADGVEPAQGNWITPDMTITVKRSQPLTIHVDGRVIQTRSHHANALDVLAETGIGLVGLDYARPGRETALQPNDIIEVIRVTEDFLIVDEPIPFETIWQGTDQLDLDQFALLTAGQAGLARQRVRVRYENGVEVGRTIDGEWTALEPVHEVMGYGTNIVINVVDTELGPRNYWRVVRMRVTSYKPASSGKPPGHPRYGITASGVVAERGVVAVDPAIVPFRSDVYVPGYGVAFVGDTGGGVKGRWIDLAFSDDDYEPWHGYVDVYYLTPVPEPDEINYRIPTWLP